MPFCQRLDSLNKWLKHLLYLLPCSQESATANESSSSIVGVAAMSKVLPQMDSICNFPSKDAQLNVELTPDLLDKMIEQYKGYYRTLSAITQDLKDSFAALFNGLPDSQVETICNKKLSLPDGTKSTPHDLLRMVQFEGVMVYARDFSASSEDLELKMKGKKFYQTHLARIVDGEYEMQWRVALEGEVGKCWYLKVANNAGRALFGLSKGRVKFPLAITSSVTCNTH